MPKLTVSASSLLAVAAAIIAVAVAWGTLHARVSEVEQDVDGLTPAVVELRIAVQRLTTQIEAKHGDE